ncbi:MAG TPA: hypothetical protein DEP45_10430, partial [Armatimonadetes bacterium]|nr:hypothetical protein [Armatimonadota bacterium]
MTTHQAGEQTRLGPYLVQDVIGSGPHGTVYGVLDEEKNQRLVLKRLHEPAEEQPGEVFSQVARVVVALAHPAIADVGHIMLHGRHVAIIGEFVDGRPLSEVLANDAPLPPAETLALSRQICAALMYAHQRCVYHTSLRPENVFLMSDGGIRITDFAIAALYGHSVRGRPNYTPAQERYFAPEFRERGVVHAASDVFSLGVLLYTALSGTMPSSQATCGTGRFSYLEVEGSTKGPGTRELDLCALPEGTPSELRAAIQASIVADPAKRPGSVNALVDILRRVRATAPSASRGWSISEAPPTVATAPGSRLRVCRACGRPVSPAGRVCLACGLLLREAPEPTEEMGYYHRHARRLLVKGEVDGAEAAYRQGIERDPQVAALHNELADVLAVQNRFEEAVRSYRRALELDPEDDDAWHDLGVSLAALHRRKAAGEALERAIALADREEVRLSALLHLGAIAAEEGRTAEAIER